MDQVVTGIPSYRRQTRAPATAEPAAAPRARSAGGCHGAVPEPLTLVRIAQPRRKPDEEGGVGAADEYGGTEQEERALDEVGSRARATVRTSHRSRRSTLAPQGSLRGTPDDQGVPISPTMPDQPIPHDLFPRESDRGSRVRIALRPGRVALQLRVPEDSQTT
jgi:hypothetical protein